MNRRSFLIGSAVALSGGVLYPLLRDRPPPPLGGELLGASYRVGHRLREGEFTAPASERKVAVVVVGGGVSGLSAGWKLAKSGFSDFEILELESQCGGNSRCGGNPTSRFPWGAHYVPLPSKESRAVRELFEELGIIEGHDAAGRPVYKEEYLCFSPQERLYIHGRWQEGLLPLVGATRADFDEYSRFKDLVHELQQRRGTDGRRAFAIPMELSARDRDLLDLDQTSIRNFLFERGFRSRSLHWYVDYACRDDFGCRSSDVSAWAGIHYFASRGGESGENPALVTWPEGNGWLVDRLQTKLASRTRTGVLVYRIERRGSGATVDAFDTGERRSVRIHADAVVFAAPKNTVKFVFPERPVPDALLDEFQYAPWMVANLTLERFPVERSGAPIAWDNVIYDSDSLGYVVATHQTLRTHLDRTVFTYYYPLAGGRPNEERRRLLDTTWDSWADLILRDLSKPHPEIRSLVERLDVFRWGHAMVRPRPGFLWGDARQAAAVPWGSVYFAHSDLSGFSLFEEAQYRGVLAAEQVLDRLGIRYASSL
jgi:protoporphyrinogen oxidase